MKTLTTPIIVAALLLLAAGGAAARLSEEPGYIDLEWIQIPDDAREIEDIDLSPALLSIAADAEAEGKDELAKLLGMIRSIRVKSFSVESDQSAREAERAVDRITQQLREEDWSRLIHVRDDDETVTVSTRRVDGKMVGLMVVAYQDDEASFVNIVGDLDLAYMIRFVMGMDEMDLDDVIDELNDYSDDTHSTSGRRHRDRDD